MDWFERLTGFPETGFDATRGQLSVEGDTLRSTVNGRSYQIGTFELASLQELRERGQAATRVGKSKLTIIEGDVRAMHRAPENRGALVQVASQFNMLEMVGPDVTPEAGITRYEHDRTQGPACAIAAGAATIFRNYFVPVAGDCGQTATRQLDGLKDVGQELARQLGTTVERLLTMKNGYAFGTQASLERIAALLSNADASELEHLRGLLRIGLHSDVEITDGNGSSLVLVSQAFCSALPVAYSRVRAGAWEPFARLVLEAAYEATVWAAVLNAARGHSNRLLLTRLGGGAFGNSDAWINDAMRRALDLACDKALDIALVSYGRADLSTGAGP